MQSSLLFTVHRSLATDIMKFKTLQLKQWRHYRNQAIGLLHTETGLSAEQIAGLDYQQMYTTDGIPRTMITDNDDEALPIQYKCYCVLHALYPTPFLIAEMAKDAPVITNHPDNEHQ